MHIEVLESRSLLSASPVLPAPDMPMSRAATHAHATIPTLTGASFSGMAIQAGDAKGSALTLTISSESKSGSLVGTLVVDDGSNGPQTFTIKGSVNHNGNFVLHATGTKNNAVLTGKASADGTALSGHFVATKPHHTPNTGTFSLSR